jgi:hypothetical protein
VNGFGIFCSKDASEIIAVVVEPANAEELLP